jgi:hypothetical protein
MVFGAHCQLDGAAGTVNMDGLALGEEKPGKIMDFHLSTFGAPHGQHGVCSNKHCLKPSQRR